MSCNGGDCGSCNCEEKTEAQKKQLELWKSIMHKALGSNNLTEEEAALVKAQLEAFPK